MNKKLKIDIVSDVALKARDTGDFNIAFQMPF